MNAAAAANGVILCDTMRRSQVVRLVDSWRADDIAFGFCCLLFSTATVLYLAFSDRWIVFDEIVFHNPIYMYLHLGRMVFPIEPMVVHPPPHYLVIAWLMRLGLPLFHAAAVVPCLLFMTTCLLLMRSQFPLAIRVSILIGVYLGAIVSNQTFTIRPDVDVVMSWITGLVALECSRQAGWEWKRLFLGAALVSYSSAVHYVAFLACASLAFYLWWLWKDLPRRQAVRMTIVAGMGACLIAVPYVLLFLVPLRREIAEWLSNARTEIGVVAGIKKHVFQYSRSHATGPFRLSARP
ncbi:MAG TPA: hypothetical protein VKE70_04300, partial [Candidatus Solibacter sp.]|nr:hypothetical protein [Candidatus Solibacter sp.]